MLKTNKDLVETARKNIDGVLKAAYQVDEPKKIRFSDGRPLTAASDNVLISRLGRAAEEACDPKQKVGDSIDRGLILLRLLDEAGFEIREKQN